MDRSAFGGVERVGVALALCLAASFAFHYALAPWSIFPQRSLEFKDTDGEITIPIEMLEGPEAPASPPPLPVPPPPTPVSDTKGAEGLAHAALDAGPAAVRHDAGIPREASVDAQAPADAGGGAGSALVDAGATDAMAVAGNGSDAGTGLTDSTMAGPTLVEIRVNIGVVRTNPVGARMGPLLLGIPQWADFLGGTDVDPV